MVLVHALALFAPIALAPGGQEAALELRLALGQRVRYDVRNRLETDTLVAGVRHLVTTELHQELELVAREIPAAGPLWVDLTFQRIRGKISSPIQVTEFDSFAPEVSYPGAFDVKVRQILMLGGQTLELRVQRDGRVAGLQGYAEIYTDTEIGDLVKKEGELLTDASFLEEVQLFFARLPAAPVAEGAQWDFSYPFAVFGRDFLLEPRCTLGELTAETAEWSFLALTEGEEGAVPAAVPAASPARGAANQGGLLAATKIQSASLQGETTVSLADGLVGAQKLERILGLEVPHPRGGQAQIVLTHTAEMRRITGDKPPQGGGNAPPDPGGR